MTRYYVTTRRRRRPPPRIRWEHVLGFAGAVALVARAALG